MALIFSEENPAHLSGPNYQPGDAESKWTGYHQ